MISAQRIRPAFLLISLLIAPPCLAQTPGTPGEEIVYLVTNCEDAGHTLGTDCFETVSTLQTFIWTPAPFGKNPTAANPLVVEIGPGDFHGGLEGSLHCPLTDPPSGWTTFRGAGRERTRILADTPAGAASAENCEALAFQDLALVGGDDELDLGVYWLGGGSSSWTNVDMSGALTSWNDATCDGASSLPSEGVHDFWGVRFFSRNVGYLAQCGHTRIFGSDIRVDAGDAFYDIYRGVAVEHRARVELFGTNIRVSTADVTSLPGDTTIYGVFVGNSAPRSHPEGSGRFEMHDGIINVESSNLSTIDAVGIHVTDDGGLGDASANTMGTAFVVKGGDASRRVSGDGTIHSPHFWQSGTAPPVAGLDSMTGKDLYIETDCKVSGCSDSNPGTDPHLMIYKEGCASGWWDLARGACN